MAKSTLHRTVRIELSLNEQEARCLLGLLQNRPNRDIHTEDLSAIWNELNNCIRALEKSNATV